MDGNRGFGAAGQPSDPLTPLRPLWENPSVPAPPALSAAAAAPKTPISLLQEACLRKAATPNYELISTEGEVHEPTFMYRVTVDNRLGQGRGKSKKTAKHLSAKALLEELVREGVWGSWGLPGRTREEANAYLDSLSTGQAKEQRRSAETLTGEAAAALEELNTVGRLQERCSQLKWPPPEYSLEETAGVHHQRTFRVSVRVGNKLTSRSEASSKKAAKRQAAELMLTQIANLKAQEGLDEDDLIDEEAEPGAAYPAELEAQLELSAYVPLASCTVTEDVAPEDPKPGPDLIPGSLEERLRDLDLETYIPTSQTVTFLRDLTKGKDDPMDPISFHTLRNKNVNAGASWEVLQKLKTLKLAGRKSAVSAVGTKELAALEAFLGSLVTPGKAPMGLSGHDATQLLHLIAKQNRFQATFRPLPNKTQSGQVQCLVQLSTVPVAVCHGTGKNEQEAQYAAAKNALEYLKIMALNGGSDPK